MWKCRICGGVGIDSLCHKGKVLRVCRNCMHIGLDLIDAGGMDAFLMLSPGGASIAIEIAIEFGLWPAVAH